jgi:hypothetical protein
LAKKVAQTIKDALEKRLGDYAVQSLGNAEPLILGIGSTQIILCKFSKRERQNDSFDGGAE